MKDVGSWWDPEEIGCIKGRAHQRRDSNQNHGRCSWPASSRGGIYNPNTPNSNTKLTSRCTTHVYTTTEYFSQNLECSLSRLADRLTPPCYKSGHPNSILENQIAKVFYRNLISNKELNRTKLSNIHASLKYLSADMMQTEGISIPSAPRRRLSYIPPEVLEINKPPPPPAAINVGGMFRARKNCMREWKKSVFRTGRQPQGCQELSC